MSMATVVFTSCDNDEPSNKIKKSGFFSSKEFVQNPSVSSAIRESSIPVYEGDTPPALAGTYSIDGKVTDTSYELAVLIGMPVQSEFILSKQTTSGTIDFEERIDGFKVSGSGGYVTGNNGCFTIYQESRQSGSEAGLPNDLTLTVVLMMSGIKSNNGNLTDVEGVSIITEASSNNKSYNLKAVEGLWWKWDADFYLHTEKSTSALKSATNFSNQVLVQKVLQNIMQ